jgi:hypothetical protein
MSTTKQMPEPKVYEFSKHIGALCVRANRWWDDSPYPAIGFVLIGSAIVVWAYFCHPSPGKAIGALATVAGIMSLRPQMLFPEKSAWILILIFLSVLEFRAIGENDKNNIREKADLNTKLEGIKGDLQRTLQGLNVVSIGISSMAQNSHPQVQTEHRTQPQPANGKRFVSAEKLALDLRSKEPSSATVINDGTNEAGNFANQLVIGLRGANWVVGGNNIKVGDPAFFPDSLTVEVSSVAASPEDHSVAEAKSLVTALKKQGIAATLRYTEQAFPSNFMRIKVAGQPN